MPDCDDGVHWRAAHAKTVCVTSVWRSLDSREPTSTCRHEAPSPVLTLVWRARACARASSSACWGTLWALRAGGWPTTTDLSCAVARRNVPMARAERPEFLR